MVLAPRQVLFDPSRFSPTINFWVIRNSVLKCGQKIYWKRKLIFTRQFSAPQERTAFCEKIMNEELGKHWSILRGLAPKRIASDSRAVLVAAGNNVAARSCFPDFQTREQCWLLQVRSSETPGSVRVGTEALLDALLACGPPAATSGSDGSGVGCSTHTARNALLDQWIVEHLRSSTESCRPHDKEARRTLVSAFCENVVAQAP